MSNLAAIAEAVSAGLMLIIALGTLGWWLFRQGGDSGSIAAEIKIATDAVRDNTTETKRLSEAFAGHKARTDTQLGEHQRRLDEHSRAIADLRRQQ